MSKDLVIQDTCEVVLTDVISGDQIGVGYAQIAGLEQTVTEDDLRGGIGNKLVFVLRSAKDITLNVTSATFKPEFIALMSGVPMEKLVKDIYTMRTMDVVADSAGTGIAIKLPTGTKVNSARVAAPDGKQYTIEVTTDEIVLPNAASDPFEDVKVGDSVDLFTLEKAQEVEGTRFLSDKFAHKFAVQYRTITYDQETAAPFSEIFFDFPETIPSGSFNLALQNGEAYIPELNFRVTAPKGSNELGTMFHRPIPEV